MRYVITAEFAELIGKDRLESLNNHPHSVYGIDAQYNIVFLNKAWFQFAEENGGNTSDQNSWSLGRNVFDTIPSVQRSFYQDLYDSALKEADGSMASFRADYDCSSPTLYRRFSMHLYPFNGKGIVVVNSLVMEESANKHFNEAAGSSDYADYIDQSGTLYQCANCRRVRGLTNKENWVWIPKFVKTPHPKNQSRSLCTLQVSLLPELRCQ